MSEGKKINEAATVSGLPSGGFVLVTDSGGGLKRLSVDALLADVRGSVKVGGRNLLLDSGTEITGGAYQFARYKFSTDNMLKAGEPFALTIWGTMAFQAFVDGGTKMVGRTSGSDGVYKLSGTWKYDGAELWIYKRENADLSTQTITRIKLERGNVATDWTPAPEDYMPTNSTSGGVKNRPLYALVVRPKGGVRHERGKGADERESRRAAAGERGQMSEDLLLRGYERLHGERFLAMHGHMSEQSVRGLGLSGGKNRERLRLSEIHTTFGGSGIFPELSCHEQTLVSLEEDNCGSGCNHIAGKEVAYV